MLWNTGTVNIGGVAELSLSARLGGCARPPEIERRRLLGDARPALEPPPFHQQHGETDAREQPPEGAVGFGHGGGGGDGELVGEFDLGDGGEGGLGGGGRRTCL
jgi:hypothetical protein